MTERELRICCICACDRHTKGLLAGADEHKYGYIGRNSVGLHLSGCIGECMTAKGLNLFWSGMGTSWHFDDDLGYYQARSTKHDHGHLLIYDHDLKEHAKKPWVLVVGSFPQFYICGWIWGYEALDFPLRETDGREPAHWVPQSALKSNRREPDPWEIKQ